MGLALSSCFQLSQMLTLGVKNSTEVENMMTSIERILEYTRLEQEDYKTKGMPPNNWPSDGVIHFKDVSLRYVNIIHTDSCKQLTF